ncbi:hypothetical protein PI124_g22245 [Phytophthora idaei]|nr:hypothetical protein PI125_g17170 [Phytophthora idaei]KAG3129514.1 hypothetical protein PI126_g20934 [Phytophthora idaei]KAG3232673.1 hypothetical protein PI124_g22245 [Phytophthora idaei]
MGLLDMALANAYITHKKICAIMRLTSKPRGEWYILLHKQLLQLKAKDFVEVLTPMDAPAGPLRKRRRLAGHKHEQFDGGIGGPEASSALVQGLCLITWRPQKVIPDYLLL